MPLQVLLKQQTPSGKTDDAAGFAIAERMTA